MTLESIWSLHLEKLTLHENLWHWKNVKMSSCYTCTIVSKVSTNCQPGVRFVIISRWKICESSFLSSFVFVFAFVIFWMEGRGPKKIFYEILWILWIDDFILWIDDFMILWKNGEVLIIDNHCAPSHSEGVWKNQNWSIIKADNEYKET